MEVKIMNAIIQRTGSIHMDKGAECSQNQNWLECKESIIETRKLSITLFIITVAAPPLNQSMFNSRDLKETLPGLKVKIPIRAIKEQNPLSKEINCYPSKIVTHLQLKPSKPHTCLLLIQ